MTTCSWAPDGLSFVTGSHDLQSALCLWNLSGDRLHSWSGDYRAQDCSITPDGSRLIAVSSQTEKRLYVYNFKTREEEYSVSLRVDLTCVSITRDSRYMLINRADNEIQLLDIGTGEVVRRFRGQKQGNYVIRSRLGGAAENFVVSGSEGEGLAGSSYRVRLLTDDRFLDLHLAQGQWNIGRGAGGTQVGLRQRGCLEPDGPPHVRVGG